MEIYIYKIIGTLITFTISLVFGLLPIVSNSFQSNQKLLSFTNCFAGGLFISISLIHLLPEANLNINKYLNSIHIHSNHNYLDHSNNKEHFPWAFLTLILSFVIILIIDKILFTNKEDSNNANSIKRVSLKRSHLTKNVDEENEELKLNLSAKYKLGLKLFNWENNNLESKEKWISHNHHKVIDKNTSSLLSYVLFLAIGFHSIFEGLAWGLTKNKSQYFSILASILVHKWAESLTIGVSLYSAEISRKRCLYWMIFYSFISPTGIVIGHLFSKSNNLFLQGVLYAISAGTFLYISTIEIITEEFSNYSDKWTKFMLFLFGLIINIVVTSLE